MSDEYTIQADEAAIVIKPDGTTKALLPKDIPADLTTDHPYFRAAVIMAFLHNQQLIDQITEELLEEED